MKWTLQSKLFFINLLIIQNETFVSYKSTNTALVQKGTIIFQIKIKIGKSPLNIRPFPLSFKKKSEQDFHGGTWAFAVMHTYKV